MSTDAILRLWGKTKQGSTDPSEFHPALFHMLDVAHVAKMLLGDSASPRWRRILSAALNTPEDSLTKWVPWAIALHDIGKISAPFQCKSEHQRTRLINEGFDFGKIKRDGKPSHGEVSEIFIKSHLEIALPENLRRAMRDLAGGHHGFFTSPIQLQENRSLLNREPSDWSVLRKETSAILTDLLLERNTELPDPGNVSVAVMALTGFTIICDWLGSNSDFFSPQPSTSLRDYIPLSDRQARQAVKAAGFAQETLSTVAIHFLELFPEKSPPRPLQSAIDRIPLEILSRPCLAVIEAPTGEGKTEAALALAHRLAQTSGTDEFYYALPTTATSNQMFGRLQTYLAENLNLGTQVKLIHGQAFLYEDTQRIQPLTNGDEDYRVSMEWFAPKKRSLLSPFGVGTIDQAELAVLNVKHVPLRMMGLAGKVLIVDEVHAYDVYMTTIVEQLLGWLSAMGTSVILLSATLPKERRQRLVNAYCGDNMPGPELGNAYPSLWVVNKTAAYHHAPPAQQPNRQITLHPDVLHLDDEHFDSKARWLLNAVTDGGCVCWMVNTVARAQKLFQAVKGLAPDELDCMILHAQFPLDVRQQLEQDITRKYGPGDAYRPKHGIVIGTQVLEQSLDLDFDMMVSDLAPIDLLLQRAGRLHRHNRLRPTHHTEPHLWINSETQEGGLSIDVDRWIYSEFILRKSWDAIRERDILTLPVDYRPLIESVYGEFDPGQNLTLVDSWKRLQEEQENEVNEARQRILPAPNPVDSFSEPASRGRFEDSENDTRWFVARTRLGEESISVIPLERTGDLVRFVVKDIPCELDLTKEIDREMQLRLLRKSLRVSNRRAVEALKEIAGTGTPDARDSALLKDCQFLWLENGTAELTHRKDTIQLTLDPQVGLVISISKGG
jgi:CRISPR-associated endonuclease/helicase Cas3